MQKSFRKYSILIMTIAIFAILQINFVLSRNALLEKQTDTFSYKINQVIHTLENNQTELDIINKNLDEDYLTRAKAVAYVVERDPDVLDNVAELKNFASLLDVDEIHIIDGKGIIAFSSVPNISDLIFIKASRPDLF